MPVKLVALVVAVVVIGFGTPSSPQLSVVRLGPLTADAASTAPCPRQGGTLRVGIDADFVNLDPDASTTRADRQAWKEVFNTLVGLTADLKLVPELAESWEFQSGTRVVFRLRHGVKFQDGTDFNADAVKFNITRKKTIGGPRVSELANVESVDVLDPYTVRFNLKEPFSPLLAILTDGSGMMSSPAAVAKYGNDYSRHPVGTGPFEFVEWLKDDHLTVHRFANYWEKGIPCLDEIRFVPVPDPAVKLTDLKAGALDLIDSVLPKDVSGLRRDGSLRYYETSDLGWRSMDFNVTKPPFSNKALRQAIAWGVDRDVIHKAILFGTGVVAQGPIAPSQAGYDPKFAPYHRDLAQAKAKLAEGGQPSGFSFVVVVPRFEVREQVAEVIKEQLAPLGIHMDIQPVEFGEYVRLLRTRGYMAQMGGWSGRPDLDGNLDYLFSGTGSQNVTGYSNPQVNDVLDKARIVSDLSLRIRLYRQAQTMIAEDAPSLFLFYLPQNKAAAAQVRGVEPSSANMMRLKTVWLSK
ncbi:MAG TPA: ABC transporter substrate-binding protein [bacterium]|nr:ABC transporter substrate-binding protein [bacterium]